MSGLNISQGSGSSGIANAVVYQGGYDASTNTPDLDTAPVGVLKGDMYTVTAAGTFYTVDLEIGDVLIAEVDDPAAEADWTIVNKDLNAASIKASYESNADTNAFTDADETKLDGIETLADVTDAANVDAAGAVMNTDATTAAMSFVVDEDNMTSNLDTKVPTQQSVKAYADTKNLSSQIKSFTISSGSLNDSGGSAQFNRAIDSDRVLIVGATIVRTSGAGDTFSALLYNTDGFATMQVPVFGSEFTGLSGVSGTAIQGPRVGVGGSNLNVSVPYYDYDATNEMHVELVNGSFDGNPSEIDVTVYYVVVV